MMMQKLVGSLIAPWLYLGARTFGNRTLACKAILADPYNLRAINLLGLSTQHRTVVQRMRQVALIAARLSSEDAERLLLLHARSKAQFHQDMLVLLASEEKQGGYFVEVGVGDGEFLSNTVILEDEFGWSGLLCEPNLGFHQAITRRRKAQLETRAIYRTGGKQLSFLADESAGELSRLVDAEGSDFHRRAGKTYTVRTATLNEALESANAPQDVDYISIDTEGSEVAVLDGLDFNRWNVGVITIEHNYDRGRRREYARRLHPYGFVRVLEEVSEVDDWYVNRHYAPRFLAKLGR